MGGRFAVFVSACVLALAAGGCKKKAQNFGGNESAKTTTESPKSDLAAPALTVMPMPEQGTPVQLAAPLKVESKDIFSREPVTQAAQVLQVLVGWAELSQARDPRARKRTKEDADRLALEMLEKVRNGMDMAALMAEYSEDPGSAQSGKPYAVRPDSDFVPEFEALALRLNVGEAGICRTMFGYHVVKRVR